MSAGAEPTGASEPAGPIAHAARLFHTVRHLKSCQIYGRVVHRLYRPGVSRAPAPPRRPLLGPWVAPIAKARALSADGARATFLNLEAPIGNPAVWNDPTQAKLWLYNLHYFDDLAGLPCAGPAAHAARTLVARWIAENPLGRGLGWDAYPTSLRIVNWITWLVCGHSPVAGMLDSLALQTRWLSGRIEWHLLGNHVLANAKALVFAGLFFCGAEADAWLHQGLEIYRRELPEQILDDGGHFERSPMYHAIILEDLLDVLNLARHAGAGDRGSLADLPKTIARMRSWLAAMTHPDGGLAFFNDATFGIAADHAAIEAYAERLGLAPPLNLSRGLRHLASSGYVRIDCGPFAAILDVGPVGPDYIPGHAHADTLSFELSVAGTRMVVNSGISTYASGPQRSAERATAAHTTVEVDGLNSSDVWGGFRVGQRARIVELAIDDRADVICVRAAHDGYHRRSRGPIHQRTWFIDPTRLVIADHLHGGTWRSAVGRWHLAPDVAVRLDADARSADLVTSGATCRLHCDVAWNVADGVWYPGFGKTVPNRRLTSRLVDGRQTVTVFGP